MRFCLLLFQVLLLFVALGVFLLRLREAFVVRELREIFMIIGGMYSCHLVVPHKCFSHRK